jgi:hypothetical protein
MSLHACMHIRKGNPPHRLALVRRRCVVQSNIKFAKFFVLNAGVLESMTFHIEAKFNNGKFLREQRRKLHLENKASRDAQFHFTTASCQHTAWNTKQLVDMGLDDPFVCRC